MEIIVARYNSEKDHTNSLIFLDYKFECYGLEDEKRNVKVYGETRIPNGIYKVELRKEGGFHQNYLKRFGPEFHKGMLWIKDVPGFEHILIHIGNSDKDTAGCLLVGSGNTSGSNFISGSTSAYKSIYNKVYKALSSGEPVNITFTSIFNN